MIWRLTPALLVVLLSLTSCPPRASIANTEMKPSAPVKKQSEPGHIKNVILMIGDGMGITQVTAGLYSNSNHLELERCRYIGLLKSYSANKLTTDSAAGATAFACGKKTYNGAIGVDTNKQPIPTLLELAEQRDMATGLVVTSTICHATPAAFIAHVEKRSMYEDIATFFAGSGVDLFIGGGEKHFIKRKDGRNLVKSLVDKGYAIGRIQDTKIADLSFSPDRPMGYFTGFDDPKTYRQGRRYFVPAVEKSLTYLKARGGDKGFFLMIEGSQIDWGGHANDSKYIIEEMLDFDRAIGKVLDFAQADGETLVVITADHETGGYAILPSSSLNDLHAKFATDYHTPDLIPVYAYGPKADLFSGIYENTAIFDKIKEALGWE